MTIKSYSELNELTNYIDRFNYLKLNGRVGEDTFGYDRYLNQIFYKSPEWRHFRNNIIIRDNGCDLGCEGYEIEGTFIIHHINPITKKDILDRSPMLLDPENVITTVDLTHKAIHYGDAQLLITEPIERTMGDTCLW
nr:MAG TPA: HNH endonuclease bacteriophage, HNH Endonuclease, DNA.52A [Caudoviricetes sp.]